MGFGSNVFVNDNCLFVGRSLRVQVWQVMVSTPMPDEVAIVRWLDEIQEAFASTYCQWIIEDPDTRDYRVMTSLRPGGQNGFDVAHRTGVIGQVFRLKKPIIVPDTKNHPLYDAFDQSVAWELCFPVFAGKHLA